MIFIFDAHFPLFLRYLGEVEEFQESGQQYSTPLTPFITSMIV